MHVRSALMLSTIPAFVVGSCYSRNGTLITDIAYQPCSSIGDSACCGTNHDGAGHVNVANDVCESSGLCQNYEAFDGTNQGVKLWWRQGCTDPTWSSPNCLASVCDTEEYENDNAPVYSCGNGNWACGSKSVCSTSSRLFTLAATVGKEVATSTSAAVASSAVTASLQTGSVMLSTLPSSSGSTNLTPLTTATSATPAAPPAAQPLLSTAAKAGIGVGIAVLILLLSIILFLLHKIKQNKKKQEAYAKAELPGQSASVGEKPQATVYAKESSQDAVEMPAREVGAHEMTVGKERIELETREKVNEIGLQRERAELAADSSVGVGVSHG